VKSLVPHYDVVCVLVLTPTATSWAYVMFIHSAPLFGRGGDFEPPPCVWIKGKMWGGNQWSSPISSFSVSLLIFMKGVCQPQLSHSSFTKAFLPSYRIPATENSPLTLHVIHSPIAFAIRRTHTLSS